ncbi:uncharacterized protein VP01_4247g1, partial [Puccinia sorghi]
QFSAVKPKRGFDSILMVNFVWLSGLNFDLVSRNEQTFVSGGESAGAGVERALEEDWADKSCSGGHCRGKPGQRGARGVLDTHWRRTLSYLLSRFFSPHHQARWAEILGCFDFDIVFFPGCEAARPDALSHIFLFNFLHN